MRTERKMSKIMQGGRGFLHVLKYICLGSQFWENITEFLKAKRQGGGNVNE